MPEKSSIGTKDIWMGLPPWARGTIIVGGSVLVVYIGFTIKNWIQDAKNAKLENAAAVTANEDLQNLKAQGINPSFPISQYEAWSQSIVQAVGGCIADTDTINAIFQQMTNLADVLQLVAQFGIRNAQPCAFSTPISAVIYMFNDKAFGGSLPYLLTWGLSSSALKTVNGILSAKGISYQF
jgi:hypothetical protein